MSYIKLLRISVTLVLKETASNKDDVVYVPCKFTTSLLPNNKYNIYEVYSLSYMIYILS